MTIPRLVFNDGHSIPQLGFGVWQVPPQDTARAVREALAVGYRSIDTAAGYENEAGVGEAVRDSGLRRDEIFVTTKLKSTEHGYDNALRAFDASMNELKLEQVDLYLIHWPKPHLGLYVETWKAFVRLREEGRAISIGVSNFTPEHLDRIVGETGVAPALNQIELHPRFQQHALREANARHGVLTESWSPLGRGRLHENATLAEIGRRHGKSWAQVVLRWHIDNGFIVIPRSVNPARVRENFEVFDFRLDADDMARIAALDDPNGRVGGDPMAP
ncbi:aldo/keto reductase [Alsobacter sp. SYSU M60028]|uniref:Aldo/keto reductase n=1 Tax=Alsobacter ponti TaxID=2962936 RepID=A0ABT1LBL7_9HYPH|nr:aldo/keto reductase [Alsobacter ponti]MCP8938333.1 aldo/keto reductase [Alsobacter ponti]